MTRPGQTRRRQASHAPEGAKPAGPCILTINGGSSSIKFALFEAGGQARRVLAGRIEGVGLPEGSFTVKGPGENFSRKVAAPDHHAAVGLLMDWVQGRVERRELVAVGHRVVHGGPRYWKPQRITPEMMAELRQLSMFDPEHLPEEILLTEAFHRRYPDLTQIACFDTAFHHDMPRVARLLPIPRRYEAKGVQRYGFHGLSCAYLMEELARVAGAGAAKGRVVLAHLGNGASVTAVRARQERRHQHGPHAYVRAADEQPLRRPGSGACLVPGADGARERPSNSTTWSTTSRGFLASRRRAPTCGSCC